MRMPRRQRWHCGIKGSRVSEPGIQIPGGPSAGHTAGCSRPSQPTTPDRRGYPLFLGHHLASGVDLWPGDMAMHVHTARHDHIAGRVQYSVGSYGWIRGRRNHAPVFDPDVADFSVDAVFRVVKRSTANEQLGHRCDQNLMRRCLGHFLNRRPRRKLTVLLFAIFASFSSTISVVTGPPPERALTSLVSHVKASCLSRMRFSIAFRIS